MRKTLSIPLNGKWVFAESRRPGSLYKPEWMLDTLTSYYFTWDSTAEETEKLFSKNAPAGGDVQLMEDDALCAARGLKTPCPIDVLYTGKILFKGQHSGDSKKVLETTGVSLAHLPASSPTVQPLLEIHMDAERTVELIRRGRPRWWSGAQATGRRHDERDSTVQRTFLLAAAPRSLSETRSRPAACISVRGGLGGGDG